LKECEREKRDNGGVTFEVTMEMVRMRVGKGGEKGGGGGGRLKARARLWQQ